MTPLSKILQAHAINSDVDLATVKILVNRENINLLPFFEPQQIAICHVLLGSPNRSSSVILASLLCCVGKGCWLSFKEKTHFPFSWTFLSFFKPVQAMAMWLRGPLQYHNMHGPNFYTAKMLSPCRVHHNLSPHSHFHFCWPPGPKHTKRTGEPTGKARMQDE